MKLSLPLSVVIPRKKGDRKWILNLNSYRNTHFHILNQVKILYAQAVREAERLFADGLPDGYEILRSPLILTYTVYPADNRKFDLSNVCAVVDKFTCDALIELARLKDDNHKIIPAINYRFGKVDKENPRVELEIEEYR